MLFNKCLPRAKNNDIQTDSEEQSKIERDRQTGMCRKTEKETYLEKNHRRTYIHKYVTDRTYRIKQEQTISQLDIRRQIDRHDEKTEGQT